ncbi:MAG: hypothetical protein AMDU5_GPLC00015G0021 [Thermoplasmatales archaeon Gpl]|nr:MAG: hypothetical protein AMDU5_GPLC00015G0021 [Thermoplasmatales archaeon Gpl]
MENTGFRSNQNVLCNNQLHKQLQENIRAKVRKNILNPVDKAIETKLSNSFPDNAYNDELMDKAYALRNLSNASRTL